LAVGSGLISFAIYATGLEKYACVLPLSVLEGFSFAVGLTIGLSQLNFALGLDKVALKMTTHKELYLNVYETLTHSSDLVWLEFAPFLVLFGSLMFLSKYLPGRPWIVMIALIGVIYGYVMATFNPDMKPKLLRDLYP
jgi:MFS superfamily sulfate permease-like transporter